LRCTARGGCVNMVLQLQQLLLKSSLLMRLLMLVIAMQ
jgi:hypothetical protein